MLRLIDFSHSVYILLIDLLPDPLFMIDSITLSGNRELQVLYIPCISAGLQVTFQNDGLFSSLKFPES
eukprot:CAMPEP_0114984246 /NCGR_PEP_ID=MMETSP0216-20121206/7166_1 /TAXON_ID=223996 /ORGANISM="Protocruzia adherens, Strain Boccale" /LENGTH=67 /DNA_ID=CAMNT_0002346353 /DNA_START=1460 /DNA_END=1660 /DNA_ORIENTATION=-